MYQFGNTLNVVIKPTFACNLRCKYCFYQHTDYSTEKMSVETLKNFCDISFSHFKQIMIIWHGGEPTVVGKDALKECIEIVKRKCKEHGVENIQQNIQTNGTLLDDEFVKYLKGANVLTGISYDGLENDYLRKSTEKVLETIRLIKKYDLPARALHYTLQ